MNTQSYFSPGSEDDDYLVPPEQLDGFSFEFHEEDDDEAIFFDFSPDED